MAFDEITDPFRRLLRIMERLQEPGGCPWDLEQTHESLKPYMIEEAYEALDAIDRGDYEDLKEELGDVLLQVLFHSVLAARFGRFHVDDVLRTSAAKMIRRHPHVFGEVEARTAAEVLANWERLKQHERAGKASAGDGNGEGAQPPSVLAGVPSNLPALLRAQRMQEKAARVGFDWENPLQVLDKVEEELRELRAALEAGDKAHSREEFGDLMFSLVNLARFLDIDAENAVRETAEKFRARFAHIERRAHEQGRKLDTLTLAEMDALWDEAKSAEQ
ncbi:MAG: nucleoside triphosphate pyrophosphohydrolase [Candidatus Sumerlaeaceae bacterium]|nr:nucleoside triphosphate pyrophosphohydrolase [Candidatus Sumerlaeaceae bacterium]